MSRPFRLLPSFRHGPAGRTLVDWFHQLDENRGARARLRRAVRPADAVFEPSFHLLLHRVLPPAAAERPDVQLALAAVAGLVARVQEHIEGRSLAEQMGEPRAGRTPVSEARLRRLLALADRDLEERYRQLARLLPLLDGRVDVRELADAAATWNLHTRQRWAYDYYQAAQGPTPRAASEERR